MLARYIRSNFFRSGPVLKVCFCFSSLRCHLQWLSRQLRCVHGSAEAARPHHGTRPPLRRPPHPRLLHLLQEGGHQEGGVGDVRVLRVAPLPVRVFMTICRRRLGFGNRFAARTALKSMGFRVSCLAREEGGRRFRAISQTI